MVVFLRAISLPGVHIPLVSEMHVREHDNSLILLLSLHGFCLLSQLSEVSSAENVRTPASLLLEDGVRATCVARLGLGRLIEGGSSGEDAVLIALFLKVKGAKDLG